MRSGSAWRPPPHRPQGRDQGGLGHDARPAPRRDAVGMTSNAVSASPVSRRKAAARASGASPVLTAGVVVALVTLVVSLAGLALDPRLIAGAPAWLKPMKFAVSIAAYLLTVRWMLRFLPDRPRLLTVVSSVLVGAFVAELICIVLQVVRGTTSHFNEATPFDAAVYNVMGSFVMLLFAGTVVVAVLALRRRGLDAGAAAGIRWGLVLCLLGMAEAVLMITNRGWSPSGGHTVGAPDGGPGLPITDWSLDHGDLRIAHFAGLHALQLLPLVAWALARDTALAATVRARLLSVLAVGYGVGVVLLAWQAERGQALLRPDGLTLVAVGALVLVTAGAAGVVLRGSRRLGAPAVARA